MAARGKRTKPSVLHGVLLTGFILFLSYFTYVYHFQQPASFFWDENYHIPSAQKYLTGTFFMEPHPPLGKLLIALGEYLIHENTDNGQMLDKDFARTAPGDFSFTGYRLFPVLLAWLTAPLLFWIFVLLTKDWLISIILSFLYLFDNALIVHNRAAMLDSTMLFLCIAMILLFLLLMRLKDRRGAFALCSLLFGASFGLVLATKALGLIMLLLFPALLLYLYPRWKQMVHFLLLAGVSCIVLYVGVWQTHFALARTVNPQLPDNGFYKASDSYKRILEEGKNTSLAAFPVMWWDSIRFLPHYSKGVPRLDLCKPGENGSPFFLWPVGGRTIDYRWEKKSGDSFGYLYLVPNPLVWLSGLIGIALSAALLLSSVFHPPKTPLKNRFLLSVFLGMYLSFMIAVSQLGRVMYLYHYFIPLIFSFILFGLVGMEIRTVGRWKISEHARRSAFLVFGALVFVVFQLYAPFTYNLELSNSQFNRRALLKIWDMHCVECDRNNYIMKPVQCDS